MPILLCNLVGDMNQGNWRRVISKSSLKSPIGPIEAARDQSENASIEEKLNGLQSLALLAASKDKVAGICQADIVRIVDPCLCEKDESVRNAAVGALRNLSVAGIESKAFKHLLTFIHVPITEHTLEMEENNFF
uniref:Uncharacterized protein n=1 Tax=Glossina austeni TaxID=7395 RepID=A0A1A9UFS3_GLOAU